jgi:hypothetical protein
LYIDIASLIAAHALDSYEPSGMTPAKRDYQFPSPIAKIETRDSILAKIKNGGNSEKEEVWAEEESNLSPLSETSSLIDDVTEEEEEVSPPPAPSLSMDAALPIPTVEQNEENFKITRGKFKVSGIPKRRSNVKRQLNTDKSSRSRSTLKEVKENH